MVSSFDLPSKVNSEERPFLKPGVISDHPRRPHQHQQKQGQGKNNDAPHVGRDSHSHSVSPHLLQTGPSIDFFIARLPPFSFVQIRASHGFLPSATHAVSCPRFRAGWQIGVVFDLPRSFDLAPHQLSTPVVFVKGRGFPSGFSVHLRCPSLLFGDQIVAGLSRLSFGTGVFPRAFVLCRPITREGRCRSLPSAPINGLSRGHFQIFVAITANHFRLFIDGGC